MRRKALWATFVSYGASSPSNVKPAAAGQMVRITGTIEGIPNAALNDQLKDQKVYIHAEHVTPEG
jgi:hypothetical protein